MDIYCDIINQRFLRDMRTNVDASIVFTQFDTQPVRLFLIEPSRYPGSRYPFCFAAASGDGSTTVEIRLQDDSATPVLLLQSEDMIAIVNGFSTTLSIDNADITTFLSGHSERAADFNIWIHAGSTYSPFRRSITLRSRPAD